MYKYKNNQLPISFQNLFALNNTIHSYPTRASANFHLTNPKLIIAHKSIRHYGPDLWNNLSLNAKSCSKLYSFKAFMKRDLLSSYKQKRKQK